MNNKLIQEGAVAGHMNHIYDNGEMTFGELKQLLQAAVDGKLRGTEKTDGQNVYLSFDVGTQRARAIRNKTHILAGGLNVEQFDEFFSAHPNQALRYSFVEALQAFEDIIVELDEDTQSRIFGVKEDNIYFNTEVMNPGNPDLEEGDPRSQGTTNVIPYDKKTLLIHAVGHDKFHPETALSLTAGHLGDATVDLTPNYELLKRSLAGKSTDEPGVFSVETHPERKLEPAGQERAGGVLESSIDSINNLVQDFGLDDSNTIQDLVMVQITPIIDAFGLTEDRNKLLVQRLMGLCRSLKDGSKFVPCGLKDPETKKPLHEPRPRMRDITIGIPQELKDEIKEFDDNFKYQNYTAALSNSLYDFTNAILEGFHSAFIADNEAIIRKLQNDISDSIEKIQNSSNEAAKEDLKKQYAKLKDVKNINTPSEGFVFDFNGTTYKFTGWFAPSNQILGTERYGRFGPIEPSEDAEIGTHGETEPLTIALFPGSFKPPHLGHVKAAEALAEDAEVVYIFISAPELKGVRKMKSIDSISADQALQCWQTMIDKSPIKDKVKIMIGPPGVASSMMTAIDFIQHQPSKNNIYAAPENATVILGVGAKGSDAARYGEKVMAKSREMRPDLTVVVKEVGPFMHSPQYLNLLDENPAFLQMLNKGKGRTSDKHLFHASDVRDFIDLAAEDPIGLLFLRDFVPQEEDVLAVLGILGVNPADPVNDEEDQVEEPELDNLQDQDPLDEIINQQASEFYEGFRAQKAPKGKKASGAFQRGMKRRLAKAHRDYLDLGRKDLTKHGGGFHMDRPKNISNAFLAEEEVDEISTAAAVQGFTGPVGTTKTYKRKDKMLTQEKKLRMKIRRGLKEFFKHKSSEHSQVVAEVLQEHQLRLHLRDIIFEQSINEVEDPTTDVHDNTGINTLKDLMKNTNILSTLRTVYKTLTTDEEQRLSFRAHIVKWIQNTLAPVKLNDAGLEDISEAVDDVGVDIEGVDSGKFIEAPDGSEKDTPDAPEEEEEVMQPISGTDTTGRNKAERVYPTIEKSVVDYYSELDNPEDMEMFYDYLIANIKLYFDKWDSETSATVEEPTNDEYDQAKQAV